MRRIKYFMSGMVAVLTAVAMCLTMSACGGNDNEEEETGTPKGSARRGVHRLEVDFSRTYAPKKDYGMFFYAFRTTYDETDIFDANGNLVPIRNAQGVEIKKTQPCMYYTADNCISFGVTMYIARRVGEDPLEVTIKGYINDKKTRERKYEIPEDKLTTIYFNTAVEDADIFRSDKLYDYD